MGLTSTTCACRNSPFGGSGFPGRPERSVAERPKGYGVSEIGDAFGRHVFGARRRRTGCAYSLSRIPATQVSNILCHSGASRQSLSS